MRPRKHRSSLSKTVSTRNASHDRSYKYQKLPGNKSFRLIDIYGINPDGSIKCDIHVADLDHHPAYEALSYTWGDPFPPEDVDENAEYQIGRYIAKADGTGNPVNWKQLASILQRRWRRQSSSNVEDADKRQRYVSVDYQLIPVTQNLYDAMRMLLTPRGVDGIDGRFDKTALHWAAEEGRLRYVRNLLSQAADFHTRDCFGETPLHYAAENGHIDVVIALVEAGANTSLEDELKRTPLDCAKQNEKSAVISYLEAHLSTTQTSSVPTSVPEHLMVWIDALCIDQSNVAERTMQVSMMDRIYSHAQRTVVWLGPEDSSTEQAIKDMHNHCAHVSRSHEQQMDLLQKLSAMRQLGLGRLFQRSWFERVWILQELVMAQHVMMYCGPHEILWEDVWRFHTQSPLLPTGFPLEKSGWTKFGTPSSYSRSVRLLRALRNDHEDTFDSRQHPLSELLRLTVSMRATKPEDKIYSVLGISQVNRWTSEVFPAPDYGVKVEDIYRKAALVILKEENNLDFILGTPRNLSSSLSANMPSWVPDFSIDRFVVAESLPRERFNAAPEFSTSPDVLSDGLSLRVDGIMVDSIAYVNPTLDIYTWFYLPAILLEWIRFGLLIAPPPPKPTSPGRIRRSTVLLQTLTAGAIDSEVESLGILWLNCVASIIDEDEKYNIPRWISRPPQTSQLKRLALTNPQIQPTESMGSAFFRTLHRAGHSSKVKKQYKKGLDDRVRMDTYGLDELRRVWDGLMSLTGPTSGWKMLQSRLSVCAGRKLMITDRGRTGLGPETAQLGSEIWLIKGFRVPIILDRVHNRTDRKQYKFRGEVYVHGLMQGEGWDRGEGVQWQCSSIELV